MATAGVYCVWVCMCEHVSTCVWIECMQTLLTRSKATQVRCGLLEPQSDMLEVVKPKYGKVPQIPRYNQ